MGREGPRTAPRQSFEATAFVAREPQAVTIERHRRELCSDVRFAANRQSVLGKLERGRIDAANRRHGSASYHRVNIDYRT